jgi:trehalose/maltose hydrolase-like predicted phosphorylase
VFGFAGLSLRDDGIAIDPRLPAAWHGLAFGVQWRGRHLKISVNRNEQVIEASLQIGDPMVVVIAGKAHALAQDHPLRIPAAPG